jgi:uncharacterized protein (TIGR03083 family)
MRVEEHLAALRREGELMARTLDGVSDWEAPVPTCPGWTVRELAHHLGRVHRWAALVVRERRDGDPEKDTEEERIWGPMPADPDVAAWYRDSHAALVATLEAAPEDLACWAFLPASSPRAFWARRQAHETAIHRVDAQAAGGGMGGGPEGLEGGSVIDGVEPAFAVDGIDELLLGFYSRPRNRARTDTQRSLSVTAEDADASWIIHFGPDGAHPERAAGTGNEDCEVRGGASELYLALWNRRPLEAMRVAGDPGLVEVWRTKATIRFS